jgi:hypothetical protein
LDIQNISEEDRKDRVEELVKEQEIHRTGAEEGPFSIHILGLGQTGASVIEQLLSSPPGGFLEDSRTRFSALAVDIAGRRPEPVRKAANTAGLPEGEDQVRRWTSGCRGKDDFSRGPAPVSREYLKIEVPPLYWTPTTSPGCPTTLEDAAATGTFPGGCPSASTTGSTTRTGR